MRPNRARFSSHPLGDDGGQREQARAEARKVVASHNPTGGYNLRNLSRPARDYEPGGERYPGSDRQFDDLTAVVRSCAPRRERCRPCRRRGCRR